MRWRRWFLPSTPDLLGMLVGQAESTVDGMDAFAAWAAGDAAQADAVRNCERRGDARKTELIMVLRTAFMTPLEPEDLFALSRDLDWVLTRAKDAVGESEVMDCPPDSAMAEMAALLAQATHELATAIARLGDGEPFAPAAAAINSQRRVENVYRRAMAALLATDDLRQEIAMRELYRRCSRIGRSVVDVAERVQYATVKDS